MKLVCAAAQRKTSSHRSQSKAPVEGHVLWMHWPSGEADGTASKVFCCDLGLFLLV